MPVVAIGFAAFAIGAAIATMETVAIIAAVGATIAAVGAVTGSKALMIAGGVIGAIGGLAGLATSAGLIGSEALSFGANAGDLASTAGGLTSDAGFAGAVGEAVVPGGGIPELGAASVSAGGGTTSIVDQIVGTVQPLETGASPALSVAETPNVAPAGVVDNGVTLPPQGDSTGGTLGTVNNPMDPGAASSVNAGGANAPVVSAPTAPATPTANPLDAGIPGSYQAAQNAVNAAGPVKITAPTTTDPSIWSSIKDLIKTPGVGTITSGVIQAGASFIAGATNGLTPAQIAALNAQAEANHAAASLSMTQQANMAQPLPVATRTAPVTGVPQGLINKPVKASVTGVPA